MNDLICWIFFEERPLTATLASSIRGSTFYNSALTILRSLSIFFYYTSRKDCNFSAYALLAEASCMASVM
jgi:hypothetical protein